MKYLFLGFTLLCSIVQAQTTYDDVLIKNIEDVSNWSETFAGIEMKHSCDVMLNPDTRKITVIESDDMDKKMRKSEMSFYLDEIDQQSFKYRIDNLSDNLYSVYVEISTKSNSVEKKTTNWEKGKEYYALTDKTIDDKIRIFANMNQMSLYSARNYVKAWYKLTFCKRATEIKD